VTCEHTKQYITGTQIWRTEIIAVIKMWETCKAETVTILKLWTFPAISCNCIYFWALDANFNSEFGVIIINCGLWWPYILHIQLEHGCIKLCVGSCTEEKFYVLSEVSQCGTARNDCLYLFFRLI
jgi:hypothetical protein